MYWDDYRAALRAGATRDLMWALFVVGLLGDVGIVWAAWGFFGVPIIPMSVGLAASSWMVVWIVSLGFRVYRDVQHKIDALLSKVPGSLVLERLEADITVAGGGVQTTGEVQIGLVLSNAGPVPLRFEVPAMAITIADQHNPTPVYLSTGAVIQPGKSTTFFAPSIESVPLSGRPSGTLECEILYGPAVSAMLRRMRKRGAVTLRRGVGEKYPSNIRVLWEVDEDKPITPLAVCKSEGQI